METEVTRYGFHTESRMRENCTYGSMRGRAYPTGRPALLYTLQYMFYCICFDECYWTPRHFPRRFARRLNRLKS